MNTSDWMNLIEECQNSGLSIKLWCEKNGITYRKYQAIHQTWFERGKQRIIKTFGKHRGVKLVGYLNYETGEIYCEEHDTYDEISRPNQVWCFDLTYMGFLHQIAIIYT